MTGYKRARILLVVGLLLIGGSALLVTYFNRAPAGQPVTRFEYDRSMNRLLDEKSRCEEEIRTAIKRDRSRFEAVVKAVEKHGLAEAQSATFSFPKRGSPDQLRRVDEFFDRAELGEFSERNTLVRAYRRGGILFVKVVMCEMGHAGTYAVMYSSKELTMKEIEDQLVPHAVERLDAHWWAVIEWY